MSSQTSSNDTASGFDDSDTGIALSVITADFGQDAKETQFLQSVWNKYQYYQRHTKFIFVGDGEKAMKMQKTGAHLAWRWVVLGDAYNDDFKRFAGAVYNSVHLLATFAYTSIGTKFYEDWLSEGLEPVLPGLHVMFYGTV